MPEHLIETAKKITNGEKCDELTPHRGAIVLHGFVAAIGNISEVKVNAAMAHLALERCQKLISEFLDELNAEYDAMGNEFEPTDAMIDLGSLAGEFREIDIRLGELRDLREELRGVS